ncbi:MAG: hypothetical protein LBQ52_05365 [Helicobacteraceae bacterium]|jgi:hypothetical protein|nr:hypothetical protein [Helicobacteraceae bacterium]
MNVKAIVEDWLLERGYSGLSCEERGNACACDIDNLMPCDCSNIDFCKPDRIDKNNCDILYSPKKKTKRSKK